MKILSSYYFIILFALAVIVMAADDAFSLRKQLELKADFIRCDELGNIFVVKGNQLTKYNSSGEKLHSYSNMLYGDISFIDTQDPFKILVYYQPFEQIEYLDQSLSLISTRIDLNNYYTGMPTLVCASYQGAFWIYDPLSFELVRVNQALEVSEKSGNLQQVTGYSLDPNYMLERDNFLYINDPRIGILIFDKYGSFFKTIPVKGLRSFQIFNNRLIYVIEDEINIYNVKLNEISSTSLPSNDAISVSACLSTDPQKLFLLKDKGLYIYDIQ